MSEYFSFPMSAPEPGIARGLVVFTSKRDPAGGEVAEVVRHHSEAFPAPDRVYLIGHLRAREALEEAANDIRVSDRLPAVTRLRDTPGLQWSSFDINGRLKGSIEIDPGRIARVGATKIFSRRGGMLEASAVHHYVKPSGKHADKFLRSGNALVDGSETDFLAWASLRRVPVSTLAFHTDTGAINSLAAAVLSLRSRLDGVPRDLMVSSFGSYGGLAALALDPDESTIFLISASTSGDLHKQLVTTFGVTADRIVTVFYLGPTTPPGPVVIDLSLDAQENPDGFEYVQSHKARGCPLCRAGSTPVTIRGDQFLPESESVELVLISATDAPDWLPSFMNGATSASLMRVFGGEVGDRGRLREVYFNTEQFFSQDFSKTGLAGFGAEVARLLDQCLPAALRRVIHFDDPGSTAFAKVAAARYFDATGKSVPTIALSEIERQPAENTVTEGASLVVAGAIASGRTLVGASRVLRVVQENRAVSYLVGFSRMPSNKAYRDLRSTVTYGQRPSDYSFHAVAVTEVAAQRAESIWREELTVLDKLAERFPDIREDVDARRSMLEEAGGRDRGGLADGVFWSPVTGESMSLSQGFVFITYNDPSEVSQADVYFTVASVLHRMRSSTGGGGTLRQEEHLRRLLSPRNFERFNDPVIQSALLRAALPVEMDYAADSGASAEMKEFLKFQFVNALEPIGDATREFCLALALGRLRIAHDDWIDLQESIPDADPIASALLRLADERMAGTL